MAGPLDTGQELATYLLLHIIPIVIYQLVFLAIPKDPMLLLIFAKTLVKQAAWRLRRHPHGAHPKKTKCFKKPKKKLISEDQEIQDTTIKNKLPAYLVLALFAALKVGCRIEAKLRCFLHLLQQAPRFLALQSASLDNPASIDPIFDLPKLILSAVTIYWICDVTYLYVDLQINITNLLFLISL